MERMEKRAHKSSCFPQLVSLSSWCSYHNIPEQQPSELGPSGHIHSPHQNINCSTVPCRGSNILSRGTGLTFILQMMGHNSRSRNCHGSRWYTTWRTRLQPQTASSWLNLHFSLSPLVPGLEREYAWTPGIARNLLSEHHLRWISNSTNNEHKRNSGLWLSYIPRC